MCYSIRKRKFLELKIMTSAKKGFSIPVLIGFTMVFASIFFATFNFGDFSKPEKTIIVKFKETTPLPDKIPVYYKGIKIGKVIKAEFSEDYQYTYLTVKIDKKDFNPPKNIYAELRLEDIAQLKTKGVSLKKYLAIVYPANPSPEKLKDGDIIEGRASYVDDFQEFFKKSVKKEKVESSAGDIFSSTANLNKISANLVSISKRIDVFLEKNQKKFDEITENSKATSENYRHTTAAVRKFTETTLNDADFNRIFKDLPEITSDIKDITSSLRGISLNPCFQEGIIKSSYGTGKLVEKLDRSIDERELRCLIRNSNNFFYRYECVGDSLSELLSKRFLILRMTFGKPGGAFERCKNTYPYCPTP